MTWKQYQSCLKKSTLRKQLGRNMVRYIPAAAVFVLAGWIFSAGLWGVACRHIFPKGTDIRLSEVVDTGDNLDDHRGGMTRKDIQKVLTGKIPPDFHHRSLDVEVDGNMLRVETTLDSALQDYLLRKMDPSTSKYIAIVVMDALNARVLAMAGLDKTDPSANPCTDSRFPAASLFKIVTASAAIETCGLNLSSQLTYNGRKYTLYKNQISEKTNKYTNRVTFKTSFAESINPVFGKIGALYLNRSTLDQYASGFGFNKAIDFELVLSPSRMTLTDEPYQRAEVACGFNRQTTISPLHGALLALTVLNQGKFIEPTIVDRIVDKNDRRLYAGCEETAHQVISPETSRILKEMMKATVRSGTSRKVFRGYRKDKILSRLTIGGKTGSIDNREHDARYDWFAGFAEEKKGDRKIAVAVLVAHEKYIGKRAGYYARIAMKHYFQNQYAKQSDGNDQKAS